MKIYYRGYLINENPLAGPGCMVHGTRPERLTLTTEENSRSAMRWIDREVLRQRVEAAGWFSPQALRV
ncbi:MAG: hypothetical protein F4X66_01865 [Chloroflexi bacterium]|nr:hypothetical protein [Chloroflexota bacterium]MYE39753.1 hypothetical protein [Chloroflexota bacterium]